MDYNYLAELLFPDVTETPEDMEKRFPKRELPEGAVVSRMAPSPTGFVHLGNLMQGLTSERLAHLSLYLRCGTLPQWVVFLTAAHGLTEEFEVCLADIIAQV